MKPFVAKCGGTVTSRPPCSTVPGCVFQLLGLYRITNDFLVREFAREICFSSMFSAHSAEFSPFHSDSLS